MIQIDNLLYAYSHKKPLFDGLSLSLPAGNIYGLLGKNGAGKSTLLKLLAGILFPKRGKIDVLGFAPGDRHPDFLMEIFLVTEEFHLPEMKMSKYLSLYSSFYPRFSHEAFERYTTEFQLPQNDKLSSLSYGQKKKFLLAFGLATDCRLLILDEPTNGLDIPSKSQFRKVVASAIHEERCFIISTHQARDMENLIDPIIILDEGKIVMNQSYEEISRKLIVSRQSSLPKEEDVIYVESSFGTYTVVKVNTTEEETGMNLELLFNAVVSNKEKIHEIFNR